MNHQQSSRRQCLKHPVVILYTAFFLVMAIGMAWGVLYFVLPLLLGFLLASSVLALTVYRAVARKRFSLKGVFVATGCCAAMFGVFVTPCWWSTDYEFGKIRIIVNDSQTNTLVSNAEIDLAYDPRELIHAETDDYGHQVIIRKFQVNRSQSFLRGSETVDLSSSELRVRAVGYLAYHQRLARYSFELGDTLNITITVSLTKA